MSLYFFFKGKLIKIHLTVDLESRFSDTIYGIDF